MGRGYDGEMVRGWFNGMTAYDGDFWKSIEAYYGDRDNSPVNVVQFGGSAFIIYVKPVTSSEDIDRIYAWLSASRENAEMIAIPTDSAVGMFRDEICNPLWS